MNLYKTLKLPMNWKILNFCRNY